MEENWNEDYLFILNQHYREFKQNIELIEECEFAMDKVLKVYLEHSEIDADSVPVHKKALKKNKNTPIIDFQKYRFQYFGGIDLFAIEGVNQHIVLTLMSVILRNFMAQKPFPIGFIYAQMKRGRSGD